MISGMEMFDNVWLVILLIRAKQFYTDSGDPGWKVEPNIFHLNQIRPTVDRKQKTPEI